MNDEIKVIQEYINNGVFSIIINDNMENIFDNKVIIDANIDSKDLNINFNTNNVKFPNWYIKVQEKCKDKGCALIIKNINLVPISKQDEFYEIVRYRKINSYDLPNNCLIVCTYTDKENNKISERILSYLPMF